MESRIEMSFRSEIRRRIEKKRAEIASLEVKLREAQIYIEALEDTIKLLPPDEEEELESVPSSASKELREGSAIGRAKDAIVKAGRPLHINELLVALGKPIDKDSRSALSGSLAAYVRKSEIFTRPAPNTFGLIEGKSVAGAPAPGRPTPPPMFGIETAAQVKDVEPGQREIDEEDVPF